MMIRLQILFALACSIGAKSASAAEPWPLWDHYARAFIDDQGRVVEHDEQDKTTSEAQAYALFFSLVANDQPRFDKLLGWTENNLSHGDLSAALPAWHWGKTPAGSWGVVDKNSASDADLWLAYTLFEAGINWGEPRYANLGRQVAALVAAKEVATLPGFGSMLLPGPEGFQIEKDTFILNPSYLPLPVVMGLAEYAPLGPWREIAERIPQLVQRSAPHGIALDWLSYSKKGFLAVDPQGKEAQASYDAIRVYLWAGMTDSKTRGQKELLSALSGMTRILSSAVIPPAVMNVKGGAISGRAGVGYSAALIPFLSAVGNRQLLEEQKTRLATLYSQTGLLGDPPHYYDQNLALFATGWSEGRYRFDRDGKLNLRWRRKP